MIHCNFGKRKDRYEFDNGHILYHTMSNVNDIQVLHRLDSLKLTSTHA